MGEFGGREGGDVEGEGQGSSMLSLPPVQCTV